MEVLIQCCRELRDSRTAFYENFFFISCCESQNIYAMKKGKIILNVARLLDERGVKHHETWLVRHGFTRSEARTLLKPRPGSFNWDHIERLCVLLDCMPEALLDIEGEMGNHLDKLRKPKRKKLSEALEGKSQEEIDRLWRGLEGGEV